MSIFISVYAFIFLNIFINFCSFANANKFQNAKFESDTNRAIIGTIGPLFGFPSIWNYDENSRPLLSEIEVEEMLNSNLNSISQELKNSRDHCVRDLVRVAFSLREMWVISMLDADGKIPPGILNGNTFWSGSYEECLSVQAPIDPLYNKSDSSFGGKYCTMKWSTKVLSGSIGLCIPDTCEESDFFDKNKSQYVFMSHSNLLQFNKSVQSPINITEITCQPKTTKYDAGATVVLVIIYIFTFFVITGTFITVIENMFPFSSDPCHEQRLHINNSAENNASYADKTSDMEISGNINEHSDKINLIQASNYPTLINQIESFFKCFCIITNGSKILDTSDRGDTELRCIHGIRFLSMSWVILGHTYAFSLISGMLGNAVYAIKLMDTVPFQLVSEGTYSVDSFFVMSGFLLTHIFLREMTAREGKISWLAFYLHRIWRLTPVYMIVMAFDTTLSIYLVSGPLKPNTYENGCRISWWYNLLYINNFAPAADSCMGWSWYLANDMQFYVISPIFLYALWRWPKIGLGIIGTLLCACWISSFSISYYYDAIAAYTYIPDLNELASFALKMADYFDKIYIKPYTRIGPYLIGVLIAYILFKLNGRKKFLSLKIQALGWTISTGIALFMILGLYNQRPTRVASAFFNAFSRSIFSACLGWVIFACLTGHGGAVNRILSHSLFIPLGRLTYCAYLVHPIVMTVYYLSLPSVLLLTHLQMVVLFFGFIVFSYGAAFCTSLLFESPTMAIERFLRGKKKNQ